MSNVYDTILNLTKTVIDAIDPSLPATITRQFPVIREGDNVSLPMIVISPKTERYEIFSGEADEAYQGTYPILVSLFTATPDQINDTVTVNDYRQRIRQEVMKRYRPEYNIDPNIYGNFTIDDIVYEAHPAFDYRGTVAGINVSNQLFTFRTIEPESF